jgi:uncharacterized protein
MAPTQIHFKTALTLSPEEYKQYNPFLHLRTKKAEIYDRHARAQKIAKAAADFLKAKYNANKVFIFGSLADINYFTQWSDIDLAAYGIHPHSFYKAVADVINFSQEFEIDLIDLNDCKQEIRDSVESYGIEI